MGNNDKHFWVSREQRKSFWDQESLSLKQFREQVDLLMGNMYPPPWDGLSCLSQFSK